MGMFDTLQFDINLLPVSNEEKELLSNEEFQTKSLDNALRKYRLTEEGCLECLIYSSDYLIQYELTGEYEDWIPVKEIHGYVIFYTSLRESNKWYEFVAKFTDGKLMKVFRNEGQRYVENRRAD